MLRQTAIAIRPATVADAPAIQAIYAPLVAETTISFEVEPPTVAEMAQRIATTLEGYPYLVARDGGDDSGAVLGYAYAGQHRARAAYRSSVDVTVYVAASAHRRGVGRRLYTALLADLKSRGFHAAFAGIALPNDASIGLHTAMGFEPVGVYREVGRKFGRWLDVSWWQRWL